MKHIKNYLKKIQGEHVDFSSTKASYTNRSNGSGSNAAMYKKQVLVKTKSYLKDFEKLIHKISDDADSKISGLLADRVCINLFYHTKKDIEEAFNEFKEKVVEVNKLIKEELFVSEFINENELNINYDKPVYEFYNEMQELVKKYGKKSKLEKQLKEEAKSYEYYAYYKDIKGIIDELIEKSLMKAKARKYENIDDIVVEFNVQVLEEFEKCAKIMTLVNKKISNDNLSNGRLNKLKDILNNYSQYGYKKSLDIINQKEESLDERLDNLSGITILVNKSVSFPENDFLLKIGNDIYCIITDHSCKKIDDERVLKCIADNYMTLSEFLTCSLYIGQIARKYFESEEQEVLCVYKNIAIIRSKDGRIYLDELHTYEILEKRIPFMTYREIEKLILEQFKTQLLNVEKHNKIKIQF